MARRITLLMVSAVAAVALVAGPAAAAHNGNNKAELSGSTGITGNAIVNYSEGQGTFNGVTSVQNIPDGAYTYTVSLNGNNPQVICTFTATNGTGGCSEQDRPLAGFNMAEIRNAAGAVVASGTFDRRGNCRDADQGGSQCEANDARNGSMPQ